MTRFPVGKGLLALSRALKREKVLSMRRLATIGHGGEIALAAEDAAEMRLVGEAAGECHIHKWQFPRRQQRRGALDAAPRDVASL